jgi:hypothetical protein
VCRYRSVGASLAYALITDQLDSCSLVAAIQYTLPCSRTFRLSLFRPASNHAVHNLAWASERSRGAKCCFHLMGEFPLRPSTVGKRTTPSGPLSVTLLVPMLALLPFIDLYAKTFCVNADATRYLLRRYLTQISSACYSPQRSQRLIIESVQPHPVWRCRLIFLRHFRS